MPKLPVIKADKLIKILKKLGFYKYHQVGSHIQFKHEDGRRITVLFHKGRDIRKGTLRGIINDVKISVDDFIKVLKK